MHEIDRLNGSADWIDVDFVQRERTPERIIEVGIQLHLASLSLLNTKQYLERLGVERRRTAIHNWVQKAELQLTSDATPDHIAVDETVIQVNDERRWLYAAVDPRRTNFRTYGSFDEKNAAYGVVSHGDSNRLCRPPTWRFWSITLTILSRRCRGSDSDFRCVAMEIGVLSNVSPER